MESCIPTLTKYRQMRVPSQDSSSRQICYGLQLNLQRRMKSTTKKSKKNLPTRFVILIFKNGELYPYFDQV